jgi:hypothetical protein
LEQRQLLATFVETGSTLQIALGTNETAGIVSQGATYALHLLTGTWSGTDSLNVTGNGSAALTVTNAGLSTFTKINIVDTGGGDRVDFNDSGTNAYITNLAVGLTHSSAGIYFSGSSTFSGTASLSASTDCYCLLDAANLSMADGDLSLTGMGAVAGVNCSIDVIQSQITTSGAGNINLTGTGAQAPPVGETAGIYFSAGAVVSSTSGAADAGTVTLTGTGGSSTGPSSSSEIGVDIDGTSSVTSTVGRIAITGQGGSSTTGTDEGVSLFGQVTSTAAASITIDGTGGTISGAPTSTDEIGVNVASSGSIASAGGNISITGQGGGAGGNDTGVVESGEITATGTAAITIVGTGGNASGASSVDETGVILTGNVTSNAGDVSITGQGGYSAEGYDKGVEVDGSVSATGTATITIRGTAGGASGASSFSEDGVYLSGSITSTDGDVSIGGQGGDSLNGQDYGVDVAGQVASTGAAAITISGIGGTANGTSATDEFGAYFSTNATCTSATGNISITGQGGSSVLGYDCGVYAEGLVTSTGTATITITGTGGTASGASSSSEWGVNVSLGSVTSSAGNILITGQGGSSVSGFDEGVYSDGHFTATGAAEITIIGNAGNGASSANNWGVYLPGSVTSDAGDVSIIGQAGNAAGGNDGGVIVLGQITSLGTAAITVESTGDLIVDNGASVQTGTGTISLAADVNADGSGDAGTATLSIRAGATVTTSNSTANAITLRGADIDIDTSANPAVVGAQRQLSTTPTATLTGLNQPMAMAFDGSGNLYVASQDNDTVNEFAPGSTTPSATLTGVNGPWGMAFDNAGNLYVANYGGGTGTTVSKFAPGCATPTATLTGLDGPVALAFDSSGNLYVSNWDNDTVSKFAPGSTTPGATLTGVNCPIALAFDSSSDLYVSNWGNDTVSKFASGSTTPSATLTGVNGPWGMAFDNTGNLYVANWDNYTVSKFAPGGTTPSATLTGVSGPCGMAFDNAGNLYVANNLNGTVSEFASGSTTPSTTLTGLDYPDALAFDTGGNLYVANANSNTVSEFVPIMVPTVGGVVVRSSLPDRPMSLGGTNNAVAGINLTDAELAQIQTTASGTVTIGDSSQTGDITFTNATVATTPGAGTIVEQDPTSTGQVILDDAGTGTSVNGDGVAVTSTPGTNGIEGAVAGTALDGNGGTVTLTPGANGVEAVVAAAADTWLVTNGFTVPTGTSLILDLNFAPSPGTPLTIIDNTAVAGTAISGTFANLPQGGTISASYGGATYVFTADYSGGDGNDLVLTEQAPTVTGLSPVVGSEAGGTAVTITGTGFTSDATVAFGGYAATNVVVNGAGTQITCTSPAETAGTVDVTVVTPGGTSATSAADQFTYVAAPAVTGISPLAAPTAGGAPVTVTGVNLTGAIAVYFGTSPAAIISDTATQIVTISPAGVAGTVDVTVVTAGGTSATSAADQFTYAEAPAPLGITPATGPTTGGTTVTITGMALANATAVYFGTALAMIVSDTPTQIVVTSPVGVAGAVDVTVTTAGGTGSMGNGFTYFAATAAPTVTGVNPMVGPTSGGTTVMITGTGFTDATAVMFGAQAATSFTIVSDTQITTTSPAGAAGIVDVTVTTPGGTSAASAADQFTYTAAAVPAVTSIAPNSGFEAGGDTVTITGTGFTSDATVAFGGHAATNVVVVSGTEITCTSPVVAAGTGLVDVKVTTGNGTSATVTADHFTYVAAATPAVTTVAPNTGSEAGGDTVTITGTGFTSDATVAFGNHAATNVVVVSGTEITCESPVVAAGTGLVDVKVTTGNGTSATVTADHFTYVAVPAATHYVVSAPSSVTAGNPFPFTVTAEDQYNNPVTGYTGTVHFTSSDPAAVLPANSTLTGGVGTFTATLETAGNWTLTATDTLSGSVSGTSNAITVNLPVIPTVTGISPAVGSTAGGDSVTITGTGLTGATAVWFGTQAATSVTDVSDTQIVATSPSGAVGPVDVTVVVPGGTSAISTADRFAYVAAATVTALSPTVGPATGGTTVTITGTGFTGATAVMFGAQAATSFTVVSDTQITAASPAGAAGIVDVTVTTPGGTSAATLADQFTYQLTPLNLVVTSAADRLDASYDPADLTLRDALAEANGNPGLDTISFDPRLDGSTIALTLGELAITDSVTIHGPGAANLTINAGGQSRIFGINDDSSARNINVEIDGLTLTGGSAYQGGAIYCFCLGSFVTDDLDITGNSAAGSGDSMSGGAGIFCVNSGTTTIQNSTISGNFANQSDGWGGGIWISYSAGATTIQNCTISGNSAGDAGGGILATGIGGGGTVLVENSTIAGNVASEGGGVWTAAGMAMTIQNSTISGNSATGTGNGGSHPYWRTGGGGIYANGSMAIEDSTVSGNSATTVGGGISARMYPAGGLVTIQNSTITGNTADSDSNGTGKGGGLYLYRASGGQTPSIASTIIAGNIDHTDAGPDVFGPADFSHSLVGDNTGSGLTEAPVGAPDVNGNLIGGPTHGVIDPKLGPLADNGGPTQTCALLSGSPAINMGSNPANLPYDQRGAGYPRVLGAQADIGAYEAPAAAGPTVTSISPAVGAAAGGDSVTITGTGFTGATAVHFGSIAATNVVVNGAGTQITCTSPANIVGTVDVTVVAPGGTSAISAADRFTYVAAPAVTGISPTVGPATGGTTVTITGTNLANAMAVKFGNVSAMIVANRGTQIVVISPANLAGTMDVTVLTVGGMSATSVADRFTYSAQAPTVAGISPTSGSTAGGTQVTITGTGFTGATIVTFGAQAAPSFTIVSDTQITATSPAGAAGTVNVTVTTPGGTSATPSAAQFTYLTTTTITEVSTTALPGTYGPGTVIPITVQFSEPVTVDTTGGTPTLALNSSGTASAAYASGSGTNSLTFIYTVAVGDSSPDLDYASTSALSLNGGTIRDASASAAALTLPAPASAGDSLARQNIVIGTATPMVTALSPNIGWTEGGTMVTITGTNLNNVTAVYFGTAPATIQSDTATQIVVTSPLGVAGTVDVTVVTTGGTSPTSMADHFTYTAAPTVTGISPSAGPAAGGTTVTITGAGLANATAVYFGTVSATILSDSATQIVVTSPANVAGTVDVTVVTAGGTSPISTADQFTYAAMPIITALSPAFGPVAGGTTVTITGTRLATAAWVRFGTNLATIVSSSSTQLVVTSPAGVAGTVDVTVVTAGGTSGGTTADQFTYATPPAVTGIGPASGPTTGGTTVTITGTGFTGATAVSFGTVAATSFVVDSDTGITATSPAGTGAVDVTVAGAGGTSTTSSADQFAYVAPGASQYPFIDGELGGAVAFNGTNQYIDFGNASGNQLDTDTTATIETWVRFDALPSGSFATLVGQDEGPNEQNKWIFAYANGYDGIANATIFHINSPTTGPIWLQSNPWTPVIGQWYNLAVVKNGDQYTFYLNGMPDGTATATAAIPQVNADVLMGQAEGGFRLHGAMDDVRLWSTALTADQIPAEMNTELSGDEVGLVGYWKMNETGGTTVHDASPYGTNGTYEGILPPAPTLTGISARSGPAAGGTQVTITGTGFTGATAVNFGSTKVTSFTVVSDTQITATSPPGAGVVDVTVVGAGGTSATSSSDQFIYVATPTITLGGPLNITYGTALADGQLTGTATCTVNGSPVSVAGVFSYTTAGGTVLSAGDGQTENVTFTPTDTTDYTTATGTVTVNVGKATPTLTLNGPINITYGTALADGQLTGTATWTVNGGPVSVTGVFSYTTAGGTVPSAGDGQTENVTFAPTDTTDYATATGTVTVNVAKPTPTITLSGPVSITYGTALADGQLTGTATCTVNGSPVSVAGVFSYTTAGGTVPSAGDGQTENVTFTPTDTTDYATATGTVTVNVAKATPTLTLNGPINITYGTPLADGQLTGTATCTVNGSPMSVAGVFSYTTAKGTVPSAGEGQTETVTFTPTDTTDYATATGTVTVNVAKATLTLTLNGPVSITYGTPLADGQLTGTATCTVNGSPMSVAGVFSYTTAKGTVPSAGNGQTENVTFTPTDTTDYTTATGTVTVNVAKATPTLTLSGPVNITYGTALADGQLTGTATWAVNGSPVSVAGVFSYTTAGGTVLSAGDGQTENVTFTPTDTTDYAAATGTVTVNVAKPTPTFMLSGPINITYGTPLADGQLTGTATCTVNGSPVSVAGVFSYTTAGGTVLSAGDGQTENVTFTPTDTTDYAAATGTATINVRRASLTITADVKSKVYGDADPELTYRLTGGSLVGDDQLSGSLARQSGDDVGSYAIQQGTLTAGNNYDLNFVGANLEIGRRALTVTADAKSKVYGDADPELTYRLTSGSLVGDDQLSGSLARQSGDDVGSYAIQQGTLTAGNNYDLNFVESNLEIDRPAFTVMATATATDSSSTGTTTSVAEKERATESPLPQSTHRPNYLVRMQGLSSNDRQTLFREIIWGGGGNAVQSWKTAQRAATLTAPPALPPVAFDAVLTEIANAPERLVLAVSQAAVPLVQTTETGDIPAPPRLPSGDLGEIPHELQKPDPPEPEAGSEALASCCRHPYVLLTVLAALLGGSGALWQYGKQRYRVARRVFHVRVSEAEADENESLESLVPNQREQRSWL